MKRILTIIWGTHYHFSVCSRHKDKEDKAKENVNIKFNIHTDKKGNVQVSGKINNERELENMVNKYLKNISVEISNEPGQKTKNVELSLKIKEK